MNKIIYRIIDANLNRVREGLRVCEEFVRFVSNDKALTEDFKRLRGRLGRLYTAFPEYKKLFLSYRDAARDVGRLTSWVKKERSKLSDVFWANMQRAKEGLRVLEEFTKLDVGRGGRSQNVGARRAVPLLSDEFRKLRFKTYELEKKAFKKLQALLGP